VVLSSVVVNLMDGHGGVNDVRLNGLLLNHRLDSLVHVVVYMLAGYSWLCGASAGTLDVVLLITVLRLLGRKLALNLIRIVMFVRAVFRWQDIGVMLLGEYF